MNSVFQLSKVIQGWETPNFNKSPTFISKPLLNFINACWSFNLKILILLFFSIFWINFEFLYIASGIGKLFSFLPTSYPGHNILTEDYGEIVPKNKTKCKKNVKHFVIHGRLKQSEIRGCSDV